MHPDPAVALDLVTGPAQGTLLVGELAVERGRWLGGCGAPAGGLGGTSQGTGWKTRSARWQKAQPGRWGWPRAGQGKGSAGIPRAAPRTDNTGPLGGQTQLEDFNVHPGAPTGW